MIFTRNDPEIGVGEGGGRDGKGVANGLLMKVTGIWDQVGPEFNGGIETATTMDPQELLSTSGFLKRGTTRHVRVESLDGSIYRVVEWDKKARMLARREAVSTIHKALGSEFQDVIIVMTSAPRHGDRRLWYTAMSRAKNRVFFAGSTEHLQIALAMIPKDARNALKEKFDWCFEEEKKKRPVEPVEDAAEEKDDLAGKRKRGEDSSVEGEDKTVEGDALAEKEKRKEDENDEE